MPDRNRYNELQVRLRALEVNANSSGANKVIEENRSLRAKLRSAYDNYHNLASASEACRPDQRCWACAQMGRRGL